MTRHSLQRGRLFRALLALALFAMLLIGCDKSTAPAGPVEPEVSTDLALLRTLVFVPSDVTSARWLVRPLRGEGSRMVPGPTDTILIAYLETSPRFWSEQGHLFPETNGGPAQRLRATDAKALLPPSVLATATLSGDEYQLNCVRLSSKSLSNAMNRGGMALHCGTGLLVSFMSQ
jgi:hypothetical protein